MIFLSNVSFAEIVIIASTIVGLIVIPAVVFALVRRMSGRRRSDMRLGEVSR